MKFALKILNGIRYVVCLLAILVLGLITLPLTLLFNWNGIFILAIANHERCSLKEAKRLLKEDEGYKVKQGNTSDIANLASRVRANDDYDQLMSPGYKHLPFNVHHRF